MCIITDFKCIKFGALSIKFKLKPLSGKIKVSRWVPVVRDMICIVDICLSIVLLVICI